MCRLACWLSLTCDFLRLVRERVLTVAAMESWQIRSAEIRATAKRKTNFPKFTSYTIPGISPKREHHGGHPCHPPLLLLL
jgi:hypothetical protein